MICFPFNTINGSCNAVNGTVVFTEDKIYDRPDLTEIILDNTQLFCKKDNGFACNLSFKL